MIGKLDVKVRELTDELKPFEAADPSAMTDDQQIDELRTRIERDTLADRLAQLEKQKEMIEQRLETALDQARHGRDMQSAEDYLAREKLEKVGFSDAFRGRVRTALDDGRFSDVVEDLRPFDDDTLRTDRRMLTPRAAAFRDTAYLEATLSRRYVDYLQLRQTFYEVVRSGPTMAGRDLLNFSFAIEQHLGNMILPLGSSGDTNFGLTLGGDYSTIPEITKIGYGFHKGLIESGTPTWLGGIALYDLSTTLAQQLTLPEELRMKGAGSEVAHLIVPIQVEEDAHPFVIFRQATQFELVLHFFREVCQHQGDALSLG